MALSPGIIAQKKQIISIRRSQSLCLRDWKYAMAPEQLKTGSQADMEAHLLSESGKKFSRAGMSWGKKKEWMMS